ncbi:glycosyltransferase [Butyricicoccus sp. 1XD8-22]|nr:glycosyltransferase [Butyricicoccus sp. 1XD8-22]
MGGAEPRKNVQTVLNAFEIFKKNGYPHKLVIVGESKWDDHVLTIPSTILNDVEFKGHINDMELFNLVKNTRGFIFPSFYEGFGLPVLEAVFAGVPAIVADNTSLKEIYNESCLMVETMKAKSYAEAMENVAETGNYLINKQNYDLIKKRFNWDNSAKELMRIFLKYSNR